MRLLLGVENSLGILERNPTSDDYKVIIDGIANLLSGSYGIPIEHHCGYRLSNLCEFYQAEAFEAMAKDIRPIWGILSDIANKGYEISIVEQIEGAIVLETQPIRLLVSTDTLTRHQSIIDDLNASGIGFDKLLTQIQKPIISHLKHNVKTNGLDISRLREIIHMSVADVARQISFEQGILTRHNLVDAILADVLVLVRELYHDLYVSNIVPRLKDSKELNLSLCDHGVYINVYKH